MNKRRGLGKGLGTGYKNLAPLDSHIHSLSAKGVKTLIDPKTPASKNKVYMKQLEKMQKVKFIKDKKTGKSYPRTKYGEEQLINEYWDGKPPKYCPDCGVALGNYHHSSCDIEESPLDDDSYTEVRTGHKIRGQLLSSDNAGDYSLDAKAIRSSSWYRPYYIGDKQVNSIKYYDENGVVLENGRGWLEDENRRDIESIDIPDDLPNKRKQNFKLPNGFIMSKKRDYYESKDTKKIDLYLPFNKNEWVETEKHEDYHPTFVSVYKVMTNKKTGAVISEMVDKIPKKKNTKFIEESKKLAELMGDNSPNEYSINDKKPAIKKQIKKMSQDMEHKLYAKGKKTKVTFKKGRRYIDTGNRTISFYDPTKYTFQEIAKFRKQDKSPVMFLGKRVTRQGFEKTALGVSIGTIVGAIQPELIPFELAGAGILMGARAYSSRKKNKSKR